MIILENVLKKGLLFTDDFPYRRIHFRDPFMISDQSLSMGLPRTYKFETIASLARSQVFIIQDQSVL